MIRSYRTYRNMDKKDRDEKQVSIELLQFPSVFCWLVFELYVAVSDCCHLFHHLPLPKWLANWKGKWGCDCGLVDCVCGSYVCFSDYYGDEWGSIWHCHIETPLQEYLNKRLKGTNHQWFFVEVPLSYWDHVPDDPDVNWIRSEIEREKAYPVDEEGDTTAPSMCDFPGESWLYKLMEWATRPWRTPPCDGTGPQN